MFLFPKAMTARLLTLLAVALLAGSACSATPERSITANNTVPYHTDYSRLLGTYVQNHLVAYDTWNAHPADKAALGNYVDQLAALDPANWPADEALAYWINLYNAVTLRLILDNYPLGSIKDLGGFLKKSPWKTELVTVAGRNLTLNAIENDIIRPTFGDPRIHFALNCASVGCPPLAQQAYTADQLSDQLDAACGLALNRDLWVRVDGKNLKLTKLFDWYGQDFTADGGTVLDFIKRYRTEPLPAGEPKINYMSYDWSLNQVPSR